MKRSLFNQKNNDMMMSFAERAIGFNGVTERREIDRFAEQVAPQAERTEPFARFLLGCLPTQGSCECVSIAVFVQKP